MSSTKGRQPNPRLEPTHQSRDEVVVFEDRSAQRGDFFMLLCDTFYPDAEKQREVQREIRPLVRELREAARHETPRTGLVRQPVWVEAEPPAQPFARLPANAQRLLSLPSPYDATLRLLSEPLIAVCAAGACKLLVDLLKAWVEERKGRRLRIRKGEIELELQGGMSREQLRQLVVLLEEHFGSQPRTGRKKAAAKTQEAGK